MGIRYTLYDLSQRIDEISISGTTTLSGTGGITTTYDDVEGIWYVDGSIISGSTLSGTDGIVTTLVGGIWYVDLELVDGGSLS
jgi:hypothetical protein